MSESNTMTYQDAHGLLINQIYAPVFFDKLANDFGISPSTEEEARELLSLAGKLHQIHEVEQTKQAGERVSFITQASRNLDTILNGAGFNSPSQVENENEIKQAAASLSQVPQIRDAALLYQDALNQLMEQN